MAGFASSMMVGAGPLLEQLRKLEAESPREFGMALQAEALKAIADAKQQVPVDTGRLRNTGFVMPPEVANGRIQVRLGFATKYALAVHERTEVKHPVGKAKYLTDALTARRAGFRERLLARIQTLVAKGKAAAR